MYGYADEEERKVLNVKDNEKSQTQSEKDDYHMISLIYGI